MMQPVSTSYFAIALRHAVSGLRRQAAERQAELQTGSVADAGLALGASTGQLTVLAGNVSRIASIMTSNGLASARLEATQTALGAVRGGLDNLAGILGAGAQTPQARAIAAQASRDALAGFASAFNVAVNGEHVFSGVNGGMPPFADASGMQAVAQIDAAFMGHFGFPKSDPAAASITLAQFNAFIASAVVPVFEGANWSASVSSASGEPVMGRIAMNGTEAVSVTADEAAVRKAFQAAALAAAFADQPFSLEVAQSVIQGAMGLALDASQMVASLSAKAGLIQERISQATEYMGRLSGVFEAAVARQTAVDPYEAGVRLNEILNTLESTILVSQRIQNLSFVKLVR